MTIRRTSIASLILLAAMLVRPGIAPAQSNTASLDKSIDLLMGDHVRVRRLLADLQQSVASHDSAAVAALVHYPIKVNPGKHGMEIRNPKHFIAEYDRIITPDISAVILKQKYDTLFANSQGVMIGDGEVWITNYCLDKNCKNSDIKIGTIQDTTNIKP